MIYIRNNQESLNQKLSDNFRASEFRCNCMQCDVTMVHEYGLHLLNVLRELYGKAIILNSAYRCQQYNRTIPNASPHSYHVRGMAWDIALPKEKEYKDYLIAFCRVVFPDMYVAPTFVHVSIKGFETKTY